MGIYKWYLAHQLTWSYLFDVYIGLFKVVPLWPVYMGYSVGIFVDLKDNTATIQLIPLSVLSVGMAFSIYVSVLYRRLYIRIPVYIVIFVTVQAIVCVPLAFNLPQQSDLNAVMTTKYPVLKPIFESHPSIFGYDATDEILIFGLILIIPIMIAFIVTLFGLKSTPIIGLVAISILGTHAFIDFCALTYFIRSYREYIKEIIRKVQKRLGLKVSTVDVLPLGPNTISDIPSFYH
uniref:MFS transporter n=1 Tax=Panagrellus redivivus TaxID=6233 RepID=A0A7E4V1H9_PANRE